VIGDEKAVPVLKLAVLQDFSTDYEGVTVSSIAEKSLHSMEFIERITSLLYRKPFSERTTKWSFTYSL
jgi:hypothetical protein